MPQVDGPREPGAWCTSTGKVKQHMTLDRRVLVLLLYVLLLGLIENQKAGDFKTIDIFNAEKILRGNSSLLEVLAVLRVS